MRLFYRPISHLLSSLGFELPKKQILWTNTSRRVSRELRHLARLEINGLKRRSSFPFPVMVSSMHRRLSHQSLRLKAYTIWSGPLLLNLPRKNFTFFRFENIGSRLQMYLLSASTLKLSRRTTSWGNMRKSSIQTHRRSASRLWSGWWSGQIPLISPVLEQLHFGLSTFTSGINRSILVPSLQSLQLIIWHTFLR